MQVEGTVSEHDDREYLDRLLAIVDFFRVSACRESSVVNILNSLKERQFVSASKLLYVAAKLGRFDLDRKIGLCLQYLESITHGSSVVDFDCFLTRVVNDSQKVDQAYTFSLTSAESRRLTTWLSLTGPVKAADPTSLLLSKVVDINDSLVAWFTVRNSSGGPEVDCFVLGADNSVVWSQSPELRKDRRTTRNVVIDKLRFQLIIK